MPELVVTVYGTPAPQGSKSLVRGRLVESSKLVKPWRKDVAGAVLLARANRHLTGALFLDAVFWLKRPAGHYGRGRNATALRGDAPDYPAVRPDLDKYVRAACDALQLAGVFDDDGQVVEIRASKRYSASGKTGAVIMVRQMPAGMPQPRDTW